MARYCSGADDVVLRRYAKLAKVGIVEIGILDGETTRVFAKLNSVPVYGIDPIVPDSMDAGLIGSVDLIHRNLRDCPNAVFIKDYSYNVIKTWDHPFDLVFIDGDHTYDAVRKDFEDWFPALAVGGYCIFHDSAPIENSFQGWPGPIRLVDEIKKTGVARYIETVGSSTVFQKV